MAEMPITEGIHPGWYIAASVVCVVWAYLLIGSWTVRVMERCGFDPDEQSWGFVAWWAVLPCLAGYYWAKACETKPPGQETKKAPDA